LKRDVRVDDMPLEFWDLEFHSTSDPTENNRDLTSPPPEAYSRETG
jgi:hypothetical protein